jgi:HD-GYP domain-containing protein (c-di-GMP phosphodiesterase class II)
VNPTSEAAFTLLRQFVLLVRTGRAYAVRNRVFQVQIESLCALLRPLLEAENEVVLVLLERDLYLNGVRIPVHSSTFQLYLRAIEEFRKRDIAGLRIRAANADELVRFFRLFLAADCPRGRSFLAACQEEGLQDVLPAIRASSEGDPDALEAGSDPVSSDRSEVEEILAEARAEHDPGEGGVSGDGDGRGSSRGGEGTGNGSGTTEMDGAQRETAVTAPGGPRSSPAGATPKSYQLAFLAARSLLTTTSLQRGIEIRHAKRVVLPLVAESLASDPLVLGLSALTHHDEYTYSHAANVCLLAVAMGNEFEMDRAALTDLGVAALLCDAGKVTVHEPADVPSHAVEGLKLIARHTALNATTLRCMRVALEHHMGRDGAGYPETNPGLGPSLFSRIVAAADCYVSLVGHRSEIGRNVTPHQALGMMLGRLREHFDPGVLWALVNSLGFYPPGQQVMLDDRSIAVVLAPNRDDLARPHVRLVQGPPGARSLPDPAPEFRPLPPEREVRRALRTEEYPDPQAAAA